MEQISPRLVSRSAASDFLNEHGYPVKPATLAKMAVTGGGPRFLKFGRQVLYRVDDLIDWAEGRAVLHRTTSDPGEPLMSRVTTFDGEAGAGDD